MNSIKGIIFDYGGTIDTNGIHWSEVIWEQFVQAGAGIDKPLFREAYVHAERTLAKQRIIEPTHTFHRLLELKIAIEADYLSAAGKPIDSCTQQKIVEGCYSQVKKCIEKSCSIVKALSEKYPTVLVTNFYGNMPVVLKEFSLDKYFSPKFRLYDYWQCTAGSSVEQKNTADKKILVALPQGFFAS